MRAMIGELNFEAEPFAFEGDFEAEGLEGEYDEEFESPALGPASVIHPHIDVFAQYALQRMLKGDAAAQRDAADMLAAVKAGKLRGIFKEDQKEPALRAKRMNKGWWEVIPQGQDAVLFLEPSNPFGATPIIDFRDSVRSNPARLDPALRAAWRSFVRLAAGQLVPCAGGGTLQAEAGALGTPVPNVVPPLVCEKPSVIIPTGFGGGVIPIIVVPGVMGTRLVEPTTGKLVWNPPRTGFGVPATDFSRLVQVSQPLAPATNSDIPVTTDAAIKIQADRIPNFGNLLFNFYGNMLLELNSDAFKQEMQAATGKSVQVYACGYDWRQDNAESARRLASVVDRALKKTGAEQCIIVAHSMGGLVSRFFCKTGGESKVGLLVLLGSPTHGAPEAYEMLKRGKTLLEFNLPLVPTVEQLRALPALYQLLPTKIFCEKNPDWLQFDPQATKISPFLPPDLTDASDPNKVYSNLHTGFLESFIVNDPVLLGMVLGNLQRRDAFDKQLGCYMPKPTHVMFSTCLQTKKQYQLAKLSGSAVGLTPTTGSGDGSVPLFSARAEGCDAGTGKRVEIAPCVEHGVMANDANLIKTVQSLIKKSVPQVVNTSDIIRRAKSRRAPAAAALAPAGRPRAVLRPRGAPPRR